MIELRVILLQSAMAAGAFFYFIIIIFLIVGLPPLIGLFMWSYWKLTKKRQNIINRLPYYREPIPFIISIVLSLAALLGLLILLAFLFDKYSPNFLLFS